MYQKKIKLKAYSRWFHLITDEIQKYLPKLPESGMLNLFIQHTSAALTINENADPSVRTDFETIMNKLVPENLPGLIHTYEGPDDMPAHVKASLFSTSISIPVYQGQLALGTWQGIYLCEFRNGLHQRSIIMSLTP